MASDLDQLTEMGFERAKAAIALQRTGNLASAIDWLDKHSSEPIESLQTIEASPPPVNTAPAEDVAVSYVCNDCGQKLRTMAAAQFHAEKSGHDDFSESTEALAPLTEEEKAAKLAELRRKLAEKRARQEEEAKVANRRNEEIRRKATKESEDAKEELQRREQVKEAMKKKREKAEEEKKRRENPIAYNPTVAAMSAPVPVAAAAAKAAHAEARLRLQTANGNVTKTFPAETTLFEVAHAVQQENGVEAATFEINFPKKVFPREDFGMTLREAGMVPSAALIVR
ncbi:hypothetical protein M433DRAFT_455503 [Acidomyces richmondensis BFW]|nr:MAG: hypothetical protein FE78DRAFT_286899 [Acidomyces sp. 'richmondensis']KYG50266.1 hypothetical protein M433DRAFT_455503 [Acidomyces richmondensis BFW]